MPYIRGRYEYGPGGTATAYTPSWETNAFIGNNVEDQALLGM